MTRRSCTLVLAGSLFFLSGCASLQTDVTAALDVIDGVMSPAAVDALVQLSANLQRQIAGMQCIDNFAQKDLGWIQSELVAVSRLAKKLNIPIERPANLTSSQQQAVRDIIADVQANWTNKYGWLRSHPKDAANGYDNENPALFTSEYLWLLKRLGMLTDPLRAQYFNAMKTQVAANQLQTGLYDRYPVSLRGTEVENFSHDESMGLLMIDYTFDKQLGFAKDQQTFGVKYGYDYRNAAWSAPDTFDRPVYNRGQLVPPFEVFLQSQFYGSQVEDIRRASGVTPTLPSDLILCAGLLSAVPSSCDATSDPILATLGSSLHQGESEALDGCIYQFQLLIQNRFKAGQTCGGRPSTAIPFATMTQIYFGPDHPIAKLATYLPQ